MAENGANGAAAPPAAEAAAESVAVNIDGGAKEGQAIKWSWR